MVDPTPNYLDDFLAQQADPLSKHLVERFQGIVRSPDISAGDYPLRLRQAMDAFFQETTHVAHQSNDP
jgi:hypothetical protein